MGDGEIADYFDRQPGLGTAEAARFDALAALIEAYEETHYPMSFANAGSRLG